MLESLHGVRDDGPEPAAAGDEALTEAAFRSGDFAKARALLEAGRSQASGDGEREVEAFALERLGLVAHYQNITAMMSGLEVADSDVAGEEELFGRALAIRHSGAAAASPNAPGSACPSRTK